MMAKQDGGQQVVIVGNFSDIMSEPFSGEGNNCDCKDFFGKFCSWITLQDHRLPDEAAKINAIKYVLSDTAILWWNVVIANHQVPATLVALRDVLCQM